MASPDIRPYLDLTLADKTAQGLFDQAKVDALVKLPGWVPEEGNTEVVLLEGFALEVQQLVFAINRLPAAMTEIVLKALFGFTRDPGTRPTATVTFTLADSLGHTIPAGTRLRLPLGGGLPAITFVTDVDLVVAAAATTGTVAVTGDRYTSAANGTAIGTALELLDPISYVDSVEFATAAAGGINPEDGPTFLTRGTVGLSRLRSTLVLPADFAVAARDISPVYRSTAIDKWDANLAHTAGTIAGHVTVAVRALAGASLSGGQLAAVLDYLTPKAQANLGVHVMNAGVHAQDVTVTIHKLAGFSDADVIANVTATLEAYLSADTWDWSSTVRRNNLISLVTHTAGVDYVISMGTPGADVPLPDPGTLVTTGTLLVSVA
jgi:hypothetical protein